MSCLSPTPTPISLTGPISHTGPTISLTGPTINHQPAINHQPSRDKNFYQRFMFYLISQLYWHLSPWLTLAVQLFSLFQCFIQDQAHNSLLWQNLNKDAGKRTVTSLNSDHLTLGFCLVSGSLKQTNKSHKKKRWGERGGKQEAATWAKGHKGWLRIYPGALRKSWVFFEVREGQIWVLPKGSIRLGASERQLVDDDGGVSVWAAYVLDSSPLWLQNHVSLAF